MDSSRIYDLYMYNLLKEDDKDFPEPKYAFNGTVNWIKALRDCSEGIDRQLVEDHYSEIKVSQKFSKV